MIRLATQEDLNDVHQFIAENPVFSEDVDAMTPQVVSGIIANCIVYIGEYGLFVADELTNKTCRVHPLWSGGKAKEVMDVFLSKLPYNVACGFVPADREKVNKFFVKCGFDTVGTINNSIEVDGKTQDQIIYQKDLLCHYQ